jgi:UDP-glucuronate 4-epimerase
MTVLVTGSAGFIGFHVCAALLARGDQVVGLDNLNDYYEVALKHARLSQIQHHPGFTFIQGDVADRALIQSLAQRLPLLDRIVHLAAQAGVRYSLEQPRAYIQSNIVGQLEMLELGRQMPGLRHLVYASSSSVYGGSTRLPFALDDPCDAPQSLYAATKRAGELFAQSYSHLYAIPMTGLRFFTVYGPWGRPDMAPMLFARAILQGHPIKLFNKGQMERDFTYIDDIVAGVLAALDRPPTVTPPHQIFNLGNNKSVPLLNFLDTLERACGRQALIAHVPFQPGDVATTHAEISASTRELGFTPKTSIEDGLPVFVEWLRRYDGV